MTQHKTTRLLLQDTVGGIPLLCVQNACGELPTQEPTQANLKAEGFVVLVDFQTFFARLENVGKIQCAST